MTRTTICVSCTVALGVSMSGGCREDTRIGVAGATDAAVSATSEDATADIGIRVFPTDGTSPTTFVQGHPRISEMELDSTNLYWVANDTTITDTAEVWRAARAGGAATRLVQGPGQIYALAIDEQYVYYARALPPWDTGGSVWRISKGGGEPQTLADNLPNPTSVAVDGTHLYFTGGGSPGNVRRVAKSGGAVEVVAAGIDGPWDIALDDTSLYVSEMTPGRILRLPKQGGQRQVLASKAVGTSWLRVQGSVVFFSSCDIPDCPVQKLWRVPALGGAVELVQESSIYQGGKIAAAPGIVLWGTWLLADGRPPVQFALAGEKDGPAAVAIDEGAAYVAEYFGGRILTLPLAPQAQ
jgi:hypothetical protein